MSAKMKLVKTENGFSPADKETEEVMSAIPEGVGFKLRDAYIGFQKVWYEGESG